MMEHSTLVDDQRPDPADKELAKKNIRLAIILGLVAFGFYIGFILMYWK